MSSTTHSLVIVGTGIKCVSHMTTEAIAHIKQAEKVLYSVNEPLTAAWIKENSNNAVCIDDMINPTNFRCDYYEAITNIIINETHNHQTVCVVFYGHPTVFAEPALNAAIILKEQGHSVKILPGISAEACLFADLWIDPGSNGCMSYETTDFLVRKRIVDPSCHLILWQAGLIGALGDIDHHENESGMAVLKHYLSNYYPAKHEVIVYEAALYPHMEPKILRLALSDLPQAKISSLSTIYLSPLQSKPVNVECLNSIFTENMVSNVAYSTK